jgi:hypothetical protein
MRNANADEKQATRCRSAYHDCMCHLLSIFDPIRYFRAARFANRYPVRAAHFLRRVNDRIES